MVLAAWMKGIHAFFAPMRTIGALVLGRASVESRIVTQRAEAEPSGCRDQ